MPKHLIAGRITVRSHQWDFDRYRVITLTSGERDVVTRVEKDIRSDIKASIPNICPSISRIPVGSGDCDRRIRLCISPDIGHTRGVQPKFHPLDLTQNS